MGAAANSPDVVVIGAGIVGAACALALARSGRTVLVVDRAGIAGGTSGAGEGNLLVSDKPRGPELDLMLRSLAHWADIAEFVESVTGRRGGGFELEPKGGIMVATSAEQLPAMRDVAAGQLASGVSVTDLLPLELRALEPQLAPGMAGGLHYPQDAQLQPMLATASMLAAARTLGATVRLRTTVTALTRAADGRVSGVELDGAERVSAPAVVNAAGTWAAGIASLAGVHVPVQPRRGIVLVTQPMPPVIRHKVYSASYLSDVASDDATLAASAVVEGTLGGTVLVGASRERVGFDARMPVPVIARLAAQAVELFPILAQARMLRSYRGWRPYSPDHLPIIGEHAAAPGLWHACGHEGAGVALAAATGALISELVTSAVPSTDPKPFSPNRFTSTIDLTHEVFVGTGGQP